MATLLLASPTGAGAGHRSLAFVRLAELAILLACVLMCLPVVHTVAGIAMPDAVDQGVTVGSAFAQMVLRMILAALLMAVACASAGCRAADRAAVAVASRQRHRRTSAWPRILRSQLRRTTSDDSDGSEHHASVSHTPPRTLRSRSYANAAGGSFVLRHVPAPPLRGGPVAQPGVR